MNTGKLIQCFLFAMLLNLPACTINAPAKQPVSGVSWVNSAAEYDALTLQAFQTATRHLDELIADKNWTAIPGQNPKSELPPAVILDVDETAISNIEFQLQLDGSFSHEAFDEWHRQNPAGRMAGAPEFIRQARSKGVTVFFITNRPCKQRNFAPGPCPQEAITLKDLAESGIESDADHVMLVGEQAGWTREKRYRQELVAETHRVIMLIGDDLGDFLPCVRAKPVAPCSAASAEERARLVRQYNEFWGVGWYILPNPMHGSWTGFDRGPEG